MKNLSLFDHSLDPKNDRKSMPEPLQNRSDQNRSQKNAERKNTKSVKTSRFVLLVEVENSRSSRQKCSRKRLEIQVRFRSRFFKDFWGFGDHLGTLGPFWSNLGTILEHHCDHLGAILGPFLHSLETIYRTYCDTLGSKHVEHYHDDLFLKRSYVSPYASYVGQ